MLFWVWDPLRVSNISGTFVAYAFIPRGHSVVLDYPSFGGLATRLLENLLRWLCGDPSSETEKVMLIYWASVFFTSFPCSSFWKKKILTQTTQFILNGLIDLIKNRPTVFAQLSTHVQWLQTHRPWTGNDDSLLIVVLGNSDRHTHTDGRTDKQVDTTNSIISLLW